MNTTQEHSPGGRGYQNPSPDDFKPRIHYLSAPLSADTFDVVCAAVVERQRHGNTLLVLPTIDKIKQMSECLTNSSICHDAIYSPGSQSKVRSDLKKFLQDAPGAGVVLLITWETYVRLQYFHYKEFWKVVVIGTPPAIEFYEISLANAELIEACASVHNYPKDGVLSLRVKNPSRLRKAIDRASTGQETALYWALLRENHDVLVSEKAWTAIASGSTASAKTMKFACMLRSSLLHDALIVDDGFENSQAYLLWSERGRVVLSEDQKLKSFFGDTWTR